MKAAEDGRNGVTIKVVENDVVEEIESDIPGIGRTPSTQPLNAPSIESNSMDISSSNVSSNLPGGPNVMQNNNKSAEQQKQAIQEGYNKRKQEAKKNSMFMKKKVGLILNYRTIADINTSRESRNGYNLASIRA